ncbi:HPr kinase/phosphorylase [Lichenibacterium minor]|uniref:HPr kinase/phosphorylase n=1 Tax=Lichenibacterium minor TaxID=2316528 RepID=UPI0013EB6959|nr:aldolase [Lichenibacterium minor]
MSILAEGDGPPLHLHASAAVLGERGVLIRGASGAGKTSLALALVEHARTRGAFARIVADDRTLVTRHGDRLVARPHPAVAGRVERRGIGIGIVPVDHEPACVVALVVDLVAGRPERMPEPGALQCEVGGIVLPRIAVAAGSPTLDIVALVATASTMSGMPP